MSYRALYRRYRPSTFDGLIGQEHIAKTLKNQIESGQISHAYLFAGTRGVGKTSAARILARAINCLSPVKGNPCLECAACVDAGSVDIIELDGASNNSVDQAREIKEKALYLPASGKYKIYIIDEVHMLTGSAFNALLKTLEEPPKHVVFILCTTEAHKIPATILSRCMRFDFALVPTQKIAALLEKIYSEINVTATKEAINAIAEAGEGSVRDALSLADRFASYGGRLTYETVLDVLGATSKDMVLDFARSALSGDAKEVLAAADKLVSQGKSVMLFTKELARAFRDMLVLLSEPDFKKLLALPDNLAQKLETAAKGATPKKLLYALELFTDLEIKMQNSLSPRLLFEAAALRLGVSSGETDFDSLDLRLRRLEKSGVRPLPQTGAEPPNETPSEAQSRAEPESAPASERDYQKARSVWADVLSSVRENGYLPLSTLLSQISEVWCEERVLVLSCTNNQYEALSEKPNMKILGETAAKFGCKIRLDRQSESQGDKRRQLEKIAGKIDVI